MSASSFDALGLSPEILRAVAESGYTTPTPIQQQAIPVVLAGRDVMGGALVFAKRDALFEKAAHRRHITGNILKANTPLLPRWALPAPAPSRYAIRRAHRPGQRSTLEAACTALGTRTKRAT